MRRGFGVLMVVVVGSAIGVGVEEVALAHACSEDPGTAEEVCEDTPVQPNWRDQYVPVLGLEDRDDEQQRYDAQRWRDECRRGDPSDPDAEFQQQCAWAYGGTSLFPNDDRDEDAPAPNEVHAGFAATHCFLLEFAHQCEDHEAERGEGVHDAHGGAIYADVCLSENPESKYCDDGLEDTQAGVTVMDHNPCGTVVPVAACTDEYHVARPFDGDYTQAQTENSEAAIARIIEDPARYLCGNHGSGQSCRDTVNMLLGR